MSELDPVFDALRAILEPHADALEVQRDSPEEFHLDTAHRMANGKPLFFAAVKRGKGRVSFHLMPVYVDPGLLDDLSPELRRRMQGKSCFNFRQVDAALFAELATLTARGLRSYRQRGFVPADG